MFRNNYPITRLVGASIIALSVMLFTFFYQDVRNALMGGYFRMTNDKLLFLGIIATTLAIGIGLVFRQKWTRTLFVIFLVVFILGLILTITSNMSWREMDIIQLGLAIFVATFGISLVYLLYNKKLNDEFDEKIVEELDDTLDSQLFRESDSVS